METCITCKHIVHNYSAPNFSRCGRTYLPADEVTGEVKHPFCSAERTGDWLFARLFKACGTAGRFHQEGIPKAKNNLVFLRKQEN